MDKIFREREDYAEGLTEIYVALAAKAMCDLTKLRATRNSLSPEEDAQQAKKVVESLKQADEKLRLNEYTWLIKGFYELMVMSDIKRAEDHFKAVHDRATKGQNQLKKKFLFGSLLGLVSCLYLILDVCRYSCFCGRVWLPMLVRDIRSLWITFPRLFWPIPPAEALCAWLWCAAASSLSNTTEPN